jgi:AcrR family transcriptional regulator
MLVNMGRPRVHDDQTAEALLDAAEAIVAEGGPDALSVRRVADEAGTTTRAVYSLFESKDGLLVALGNRAFEILGSWINSYPRTDDPAADLVNAIVHNFRRWALEHPALFRIAFQRTGELPPQLTERFRPARLKALADLVEIVSRALDLEGGLTNPEVRDATITIDALCEGLALLELRDGLPPDRAEDIWREAFAALISGMQTAPARATNPITSASSHHRADTTAAAHQATTRT